MQKSQFKKSCKNKTNNNSPNYLRDDPPLGPGQPMSGLGVIEPVPLFGPGFPAHRNSRPARFRPGL